LPKRLFFSLLMLYFIRYNPFVHSPVRADRFFRNCFMAIKECVKR
jgi:hypothetical protein